MSDAHRMLAALANERLVRQFAAIVLKEHETSHDSGAGSRRDIAALVASGLVRWAGDSTLEVNMVGIENVLAGPPGGATEETNKWLDEQGKIRAYPRRAGERATLLTQIGAYVLEDDETVTEAELNTRLGRYTKDVATLRRYLIVHGIVARKPDGSEYWRP